MSGPGTQMVAIDVVEAAEAAATCSYVRDWLRACPKAADSLVRFTASPAAPAVLVAALDRLVGLLGRLVPSVSPDRVTTSAPLGPGEALGLAELLVDLAGHRWPADPGQGEALEDDCRRWALRLLRVPGVIG